MYAAIRLVVEGRTALHLVSVNINDTQRLRNNNKTSHMHTKITLTNRILTQTLTNKPYKAKTKNLV